jgi:hypothetical protein
MRTVMAALVVCSMTAPAGAATVVSHKTGATATVGSDHAAAFQAYINDVEAAGGVIIFMGGYRKGRCSPRHMHSCNKALDLCQTRRDVVDPRCHLPHRAELARIAARHGLFEGGQWCDGDYGHAQVGLTAAACGQEMVARRRPQRRYVTTRRKHHHRRYRVAHR